MDASKRLFQQNHEEASSVIVDQNNRFLRSSVRHDIRKWIIGQLYVASIAAASTEVTSEINEAFLKMTWNFLNGQMANMIIKDEHQQPVAEDDA